MRRSGPPIGNTPPSKGADEVDDNKKWMKFQTVQSQNGMLQSMVSGPADMSKEVTGQIPGTVDVLT